MAQVVVELTADESKLLASYRKVRDAQEKVDKGHKQTKQSHDGAFGSSALASLGSYAAGMIGISTAISTVTGTLRDYIAKADELAAKQRTGAKGLGPLAQLAALSSDPKREMERLIRESKANMLQGAGMGMLEAAQLQFALTSADLGQFREAVATMVAADAVQDPSALLAAVSAVRKSMGADAGTFQEIMSKGLGASAGAPAFVEEILQAVAKAGPSSKELKIPQSELYGAIALFAGVAGSASEGGTLATDLMTAIEKFGIEGGYLKRGKTLQQHVADIAKYEAGGMSVYDVLGGRKEAVAAYRMLRNEPEQWQRWMQSVDTASKVNAYANMVGLSSQIPELQVPIAQKSAAAAEELSGERTALIASLEQAILSDVTAGMRERGFGMVAQRIMSLGNQISRTGYRAYDAFFGFSDTSFIEAHREAASDKTRQAIDNFLQASEAQLRAAQAMERMAPVHGVAE